MSEFRIMLRLAHIKTRRVSEGDASIPLKAGNLYGAEVARYGKFLGTSPR